MGKCVKRVGICLLCASLVWGAMLVIDKNTLQKELIRLHVVAASDSQEDQELKLRVRDAVVESMQKDMADIADVEQANSHPFHTFSHKKHRPY